MITVYLKLNSVLKRHVQEDDTIVKFIIEEGMTIKQLFDLIGILPEEVGIVKLNDKVVNQQEILLNNSTLEAILVFGGG